jgi:hypothetical protein
VAYARFDDDCDVYVFSTGGELLCMDCAFGSDFKTKTTAAMISHLSDHMKGGHEVPDDVFTDLLHDQEENDAEFSHSD